MSLTGSSVEIENKTLTPMEDVVKVVIQTNFFSGNTRTETQYMKSSEAPPAGTVLNQTGQANTGGRDEVITTIEPSDRTFYIETLTRSHDGEVEYTMSREWITE